MRKRKSKSKLICLMSSEEKETGKYYPSISECEGLFSLINKEVFKSEFIDTPKIVIKKKRKCWGQTIGNIYPDGRKTCEIHIHCKVKSQKHLIQILAHEMVHFHEFSELDTMSHGSYFTEWKETFAKFKIEIGGEFEKRFQY